MGNSPKIYLSLNPPKDLPYKEIEKSREGRTQKVLFSFFCVEQINEWDQMDREATAHLIVIANLILLSIFIGDIMREKNQ